MWTQDDFPGAHSVPWQLLIRARYTFEIDALIASTVVRAVAVVGSHALTQKVAEAANAGVRASKRDVEATDSQRVAFVSAAADWEDGGICPPWWPWHGPRPHYVDDLSDALVAVVLERASTLVSAGGSQQLQKALGGVLQEGFAG
jgi:hypothetical protein